MTIRDIARIRLLHQQLATTNFTTPQQVVSWMIAQQAQEYSMAKWAIGLRAKNLTDVIVEKAFNEGAILRIHLMRPTWHFVAPADIRWLLALTAPRVHALSAFYYRRAELDAKLFSKTQALITKALEGGKHLTRSALQSEFAKAKIKAEGERLSYIMMQAELEGLICSGPRQGKQFTYALLEERVAPVQKLSRAEALAAFVQRYFTSRGPATLQDFSYWSGLTLKDAKEGASALPSSFLHETINGEEYIFLEPDWKEKNNYITTFLMPDYDEYGMSYKNRSALSDPNFPPIEGSAVYSHWVVLDGRIAGTWTRTEKNKKIFVEANALIKLSKLKEKEVVTATKRCAAFFNNESPRSVSPPTEI
jgi:hypothetical protein